MNFLKKLEIGIEEIIILFLITIELLDFFKIIPPELEFVEKSVALIAMTYLFYRVSVTRVIFGRREKVYDAMIVVSWFLISVNTIIGFAISVGEEKILASNLYMALAQNFYIIERTGFIAGITLLLVISILLVRERVEKTCLMQIIHEQKKAADWKHKLLRFFVIYLVLLAFYLLVYSFAIEWLAITVDAPIIVAVLLAYLVFIVKKRKEIKTATLLEKISEKSEEFYERFITLFHAKRTIMIAVAGLLALHLIVEIGHFIIPYITGLMYTWYFKQLGPGHEPIISRIAYDLTTSSGAIQNVAIIGIYLANIIAIVSLFLVPIYIWYHMYNKKPIQPKNISWIFFGSLTVFLLRPIFKISQINSKILMGADITTQTLQSLDNLWFVLLISAVVAFIFYILGRKNVHRTTKLALGVSLVYFAYYLGHFFIDVARRYVQATVATAQDGQYFTAAHLLIFLTMTIAFYVSGFFAFVYKALWKQKV